MAEPKFMAKINDDKDGEGTILFSLPPENFGHYGFLAEDVNEIYCKTASGQCNVYSLHVLENTHEEDALLISVCLSGRIFIFSRDKNTEKNKFKFRCAEFDVRQELPSFVVVDFEVVSSCARTFRRNSYIFLACVNNNNRRSAHVAKFDDENSSAANFTPAENANNTAGLIVIVKILRSPQKFETSCVVAHTIFTNFSPVFITPSPNFSWKNITNSEDDDIFFFFVSGSDRSTHGYRFEISGQNETENDTIRMSECFLAESVPEFCADFLSQNWNSCGTILCNDVFSEKENSHNYSAAYGFDSGHVFIYKIENSVPSEPLQLRFDTPVSAVRFAPAKIGKNQACSPFLLIAPTIGPAYLYSMDDSTGAYKKDPTFTLDLSDRFDCILCAETFEYTVCADDQKPVVFLLLGTFGGKVLLYTIDEKSVALKRMHSFLSPVVSIKRYGQKHLAILLTNTVMVFEL